MQTSKRIPMKPYRAPGSCGAFWLVNAKPPQILENFSKSKMVPRSSPKSTGKYPQSWCCSLDLFWRKKIVNFGQISLRNIPIFDILLLWILFHTAPSSYPGIAWVNWSKCTLLPRSCDWRQQEAWDKSPLGIDVLGIFHGDSENTSRLGDIGDTKPPKFYTQHTHHLSYTHKIF